jgi:Lon protease-like protein
MSDSSCGLPAVVPVFPLPEVVLFPGALLPLHVFEPRYGEMTADTVAGHKHLMIVSLSRGFEPLYYTRHAPIRTFGCLSRIVACEKLDDGRYNMLVKGIERARIVQECGEKAYREAAIEFAPSHGEADDADIERVRRQLNKRIRKNGVLDSGSREMLLRMINDGAGLAALSDAIASCLPMPYEMRQILLEELCPLARCESLMDHLKTCAGVEGASRRHVRRLNSQDLDMN